MSVAKGWSLWTPSSLRQLPSLLHPPILPPFLISQLNGLGVTQGHMTPSFLPYFPWGQFRLSPRGSEISAGSSGVQTLVWTLSTIPPVVTGRLGVPPWWYDFLVLCPWWYIFRTVLGFVGTFWWALSRGRFPSLVGNCQGCVVAKIRSLPVSYIPRPSMLAWGVCASLLWGLTPQMPYFHWSINVILSGLPRRLSANLGKYCCRDFHEDSLGADCCPRHFLLHSWWAWRRFFPVRQLV